MFAGPRAATLAPLAPIAVAALALVGDRGGRRVPDPGAVERPPGDGGGRTAPAAPAARRVPGRHRSRPADARRTRDLRLRGDQRGAQPAGLDDAGDLSRHRAGARRHPAARRQGPRPAAAARRAVRLPGGDSAGPDLLPRPRRAGGLRRAERSRRQLDLPPGRPPRGVGARAGGQAGLRPDRRGAGDGAGADTGRLAVGRSGRR